MDSLLMLPCWPANILEYEGNEAGHLMREICHMAMCPDCRLLCASCEGLSK